MFHLKTSIPGYELLDLFCFIIALGCSLGLVISFNWAYWFNNYWFIVKINSIREAHLELLLLNGLMLLLFYNLFLKHKIMRQKKL